MLDSVNRKSWQVYQLMGAPYKFSPELHMAEFGPVLTVRSNMDR